MFTAPATKEDALGNRLSAVIRKASDTAPRSLQAHIGPSEIGDPCVRRIAYKLMDWPQTNNTSDPWPSISGTAIHAWLAEAFTADSDNWLVETKVTMRPNLSGTCDLFDIANGIVIDHKCVGATSMKARKSGGPTEQQITQINLYGYGLEQAGYTVNKVALAYYPLGGMLTGIHTWIADYDRQIALDAIARLDMTTNLVLMLDPETTPDNFGLIPATPTTYCTYCPWFLPASENTGVGCAGQSKAQGATV